MGVPGSYKFLIILNASYIVILYTTKFMACAHPGLVLNCDFHSNLKIDIFFKTMYHLRPTVYPKKYAHGFVVLCFVVVMQSLIMNSHEVFIHIHQGCFAGTGAIVRLPQCQWSKPDGHGKISPCLTTTKHSKANTVCIFLGICCTSNHIRRLKVGFSYLAWTVLTSIPLAISFKRFYFDLSISNTLIIFWLQWQGL